MTRLGSAKVYWVVMKEAPGENEEASGQTTALDRLIGYTENQDHGKREQDVDHVAIDEEGERSPVVRSREEMKQTHTDGDDGYQHFSIDRNRAHSSTPGDELPNHINVGTPSNHTQECDHPSGTATRMKMDGLVGTS
jgi:hypothetical protein